jgi:hypothetical protein
LLTRARRSRRDLAYQGPDQLFLVAVIWIIIGIINVVYARRN